MIYRGKDSQFLSQVLDLLWRNLWDTQYGMQLIFLGNIYFENITLHYYINTAKIRFHSLVNKCFHVYWQSQLEETIKLAKVIESTGVSALAVHGRTKEERPRHPVREEYIKAIAEAVHIPVIAKSVIHFIYTACCTCSIVDLFN